MAAYTGCIAGAPTEQESRARLAGVGLVDAAIPDHTRFISSRSQRSSAPGKPTTPRLQT
jgi:hypothetical protein